MIFIDEPETALSLRNQFLLHKEIMKAMKRGCQLFIATHNLILIQSTPNVLSLEDRQWMSSSDFIESQKKKKVKKSI